MSKENVEKTPVIIGDGTWFREENGTAYIIGNRCKVCKRQFFPKRGVCPHCKVDGTMEPMKLSTRGKLGTFVIPQVAAVGFKAPYIIGYVNFPEVSDVFGPIVGFEPKEGAIKEGQEVEVRIGKIAVDEFGNDVIGYMFGPVTKTGKGVK